MTDISLRSVRDIGDVRGKRVLVRVDLNVPVKDGVVADDFRIKKTLPTLELLRNAGAKIILISHCEGKESTTLTPAFEYLKKLMPVSFISQYVDDTTHGVVEALSEGEALLLENLRQYEGEKENDEAFAISLASLADFYVNEAFSASHRTHASIVGVPKHIPAYAGLLFEHEVQNLSKATNPPHPFVFILGGAKFDTKLPLVKKFIDIADTVCIGGALANNVFKELGYEVGNSVVSDGSFGLAEMYAKGNMVLPIDVVVQREDGSSDIVDPNVVQKDDVIVDAGPQTVMKFAEVVAQAKYVLWNGPLGNFEIGFKDQTLGLAQIIAESAAESVLGGADTLAAIAELGLYEKFSFVSSGGGAMLDFLANGTLPGIEVLKK